MFGHLQFRRALRCPHVWLPPRWGGSFWPVASTAAESCAPSLARRVISASLTLSSHRLGCFGFCKSDDFDYPLELRSSKASAPLVCSPSGEVGFGQSVCSDQLGEKAGVWKHWELKFRAGSCVGGPRLPELAAAVSRPCLLENLAENIKGGTGRTFGICPVGSVGKFAGLLLSFVLVPGFGSSTAVQPSYILAMDDLVAGIITMCGALGFLQFFKELAKRNVIDQTLNRKLVHITVGLGFMLFWPLFTVSPLAPYLAAFSVAANCLQIVAVALGLLRNEAMVKSMSRNGDPRELLKGPLYYGVTIVVTTVFFWRTSPVGIVAVVNLCAGDGFADIIGRKFGKSKLSYNKHKSYAGSAGFFVMSALFSMLYLSYFSAFGYFTISTGTLVGVLLVSSLSALVESLPISTNLDDNLTVPVAALVFGKLFLPST